jgi:hypothetical protein
LQIGGNDLGDGIRRLAIVLAGGEKSRHRDRQRLKIALGNIQPHDGAGRTRHRRQTHAQRTKSKRVASREQKTRSILRHHEACSPKSPAE